MLFDVILVGFWSYSAPSPDSRDVTDSLFVGESGPLWSSWSPCKFDGSFPKWCNVPSFFALPSLHLIGKTLPNRGRLALEMADSWIKLPAWIRPNQPILYHLFPYANRSPFRHPQITCVEHLIYLIYIPRSIYLSIYLSIYIIYIYSTKSPQNLWNPHGIVRIRNHNSVRLPASFPVRRNWSSIWEVTWICRTFSGEKTWKTHFIPWLTSFSSYLMIKKATCHCQALNSHIFSFLLSTWNSQ